jgi:hypothetical protein
VQNFLFANGPLASFDFASLPVETIVTSGLSGLVFIGPLLLGAMLLAGLAWLILFLVRRFRWPSRPTTFQGYTPLTDSPTRRLILQLFQRAVTLLARQNILPRQTWETFSEYTERVADFPQLPQLGQAAEIAAYRPDAPEEGLVERAKRVLDVLKRERQ